VGARKELVWTVTWIYIRRCRKSFHRLFTSKLFTNKVYVQPTYVPRRTAASLVEVIRSYSDFFISHRRARWRPYPLDELSISDVARTDALGRFNDLERLLCIEHDQVRLVQRRTGHLRGWNWACDGIGLEDEDAPNLLTRQPSSVCLRRKAAMEAREREKETEKEGLSRASSVAWKVGARESIMSVGSTGSEGHMDSSIPQSTPKC
jgi:hypothetical protein